MFIYIKKKTHNGIQTHTNIFYTPIYCKHYYNVPLCLFIKIQAYCTTLLFKYFEGKCFDTSSGKDLSVNLAAGGTFWSIYF